MRLKDEASRTALLIGEEGVEILSRKMVAIFGIGGVGGYVCEALARCKIGAFELIDCDVVSLSNINRQIIALQSTIGQAKTKVMKERILDINPDAEVLIRDCFFLPENSEEFDFSKYDYVVDAVDTVSAKLEIIRLAKAADVPVISCMGAGNRLDPTAFKVCDIFETSHDPLARVMRREMRKRGIESLKVVCSDEEPIRTADEPPARAADEPPEQNDDESGGHIERKIPPGSIAFCPSVAGLIMASEVVRDLCQSALGEI